MKPRYKLPRIVRSKNGDWFVKYFYELPNQPGKYKEFRVRDGVNFVHDLAAKEKAIQALRKDIETALKKNGYSPFDEERKLITKISQAEDQIQVMAGEFTLKDGIEAFMKYCKWKNLSPNTIRTYQVFVNNFTNWLTDNNMLDMRARDFLETSYYDFVDSFSDAEEWTPRTYNNHVRFMGTLFSRMQSIERKKEREVRYKINLEEPEYKSDTAEKNRAYSGVVAQKVKKELEKPEYKRLQQFVKFIYLSCIRPKEIRLLKIENIDTTNRQIKVIGPTAKTGDRFVPISDELMDLLNELKVNDLPINYYLFGKGGEPGAYPHGAHYFGEIYKKVKVALGLDIHIYSMYGWKHTRVIELINAGFSDREIMELTGHRDHKSFMAYRRDLVVQSTKMKGKTVGWN